MGSKEKAFVEIQKILGENGLTIADYLQFDSMQNSSLLSLPAEEHARYCALFDEISDGIEDRLEKGKKLEELVYILFQDAGLFECRRNCRTSTNEIDLLLSWSDIARLSGIPSSFPEFGTSFICECKNYSGKIGVTYIGKFFSLLHITNLSFGVMIAWDGVTGRSEWADSKGLLKKIALRDKVYIIYIDKTDLRDIYEQRKTIYGVMHDKIEALKADISYSKYISNHEAETSFRSE